jgi:hypothetical protein
MTGIEPIKDRLLKRAHAELVERDECIAKLHNLLRRAHSTILEGYCGGEWSWYVPDEVTLAAAKEQTQALELVNEMRRACGWGIPEGDDQDLSKLVKKTIADPQVAHADLYSMLVGQVRYSLGRSSYIVGDACSQVRRYWRHLREGERAVIGRDVVEELARYERMGRTCGDACDQSEWERLVAWMAENKAI